MRNDIGGGGGPNAQGGTLSVGFVIGLTGLHGGLIEAPFGHEGLGHELRGGEPEVADLLGDDGTFVLRLEAGDKLGLEAASFLGVQVAHLLRHVNQRGDGFVVALFGAFLSNTASTTNLNRDFLTRGVTNKLARLLLNVPGGTSRLVHCLANVLSLTIAHLLQGPVALLHLLLNGLLLERDLTGLLKVLLTNLLLSGLKLCNICVMALFDIFVSTLEDGLLFQRLHLLFFQDTPLASLGVEDSIAEVNGSTLNLLATNARQLSV